MKTVKREYSCLHISSVVSVYGKDQTASSELNLFTAIWRLTVKDSSTKGHWNFSSSHSFVTASPSPLIPTYCACYGHNNKSKPQRALATSNEREINKQIFAVKCLTSSTSCEYRNISFWIRNCFTDWIFDNPKIILTFVLLWILYWI